MDDAGAVGDLAAGDPVLEQRLHQRSARVPGGGMDDHSRRLVDDEQMLVLVRDPQLAPLRLQGDALPLPGIDLQQLSAREPVALRARFAVHPYRAGPEQALGLGARGDLRQRGKEPVEPLAGSFGRNQNVYRERVSPSRIAAKRMPTPTTMKVSARLKAGQ
jgi:hypothetical protein